MQVQIDFVDFSDTGISAKNVFLNTFKHGGSEMLKECWLVDDEFVVVTKNDEQIIVNRDIAKAWTTLHPIDWLKGEQHTEPGEMDKILRARKAAKK